MTQFLSALICIPFYKSEMCPSIFKRKTEFPLEFSLPTSPGWGEAENRLLVSPWSHIPQVTSSAPTLSELAYRTSATGTHWGGLGACGQDEGLCWAAHGPWKAGRYQTTRLARGWLLAHKDLIPKQFQVLAPWYQGQNGTTRECCRSQIRKSRIGLRWQWSSIKATASHPFSYSSYWNNFHEHL